MSPLELRRAALCQAAAALFGFSSIAAPQPGAIDPTFNAGRGPIQVASGIGYGVVLQEDGKIVVGGSFNGIGLDPSTTVVRFNSDGSLDSTFDSSSVEIDAIVNPFYTKPLCLQTDGKIIIGGMFETADGAHHSLLRLETDGIIDIAFNPVVKSADESYPPLVEVAIVQPDAKLLISGSFASVNGMVRPSLARLNPDGTLDTGFAPAAGGFRVALQQDGKILVGSDLVGESGSGTIVRLNSDGSFDSSFQSDVNNPRNFLIQSDGKIVVSEDVFFGEIFQTSRLNSDGSLDQSYAEASGFAVGLDSNDRVLLTKPGLALERLETDGSHDSTFQAYDGFDLTVLAVVEQPDDKLVAVGQGLFAEPLGIQRLLPNGGPDSSFDPGLGLTNIYEGWIDRGQLLPDGKILVSGTFTHIDTLPRKNIALLNHDGTPDAGSDADALLSYVPGLFAAQPDGKILIQTQDFPNDILRLTSTYEIDPTFDYIPPTLAGVAAIAPQPDGKILVGHGDTFLRLLSDGSSDPSFDSGLDAGKGVSRIIVQPDGKILISGNYSSINGHPGVGPARLNSDGSFDESFGFPGGIVSTLVALQLDGKILITDYNLFLFLRRVNSDGSNDESFNNIVTGPNSTALERDGIYLATNTVTRFHSDGTPDSSFAPVFASDANVNQLILQVDGQVIAAGNFTQVNGAAVNGIVRLNGVAPEKVANISTRAMVGTLDAVEIGGFIVTGTAEKSVVIRAIGPSLQVGESPLVGVLSNPRLELHDSAGQMIAQNNDWRESQEANVAASGLAPLNDKESAIVTTLAPGAYTAVVQGQDAESGIALVEVYDISAASDARLANISTRGSVQIGDDVMIAGLILAGPASAPIVARAIGPSLTALDVAGALSDPTLELHDQSGALIASNNDWRETQEAELVATGLAPTNDKEAAILATLPPGPYTAITRGANGTTGVGLVEFYDLR